MITIQYNREGLEYDSHAMITSFYPGTESKQMLVTDLTEPLPADTIRIVMDAERETGSVSFARGEILPEDQAYVFTPPAGGKSADFKHAWKLFFYDTLAAYAGRTLPWGALSGVRPTKLIMAKAKEIARGDILSEEEEMQAVCRSMAAEYRVSAQKAELGYRIAMLEDRILEPFRYEGQGQEGYSIYIGIPFCPSTCLYCSFLSYPIAAKQKQVGAYLEGVKQEMAAAAEIMSDKRLDTVYIGGGTPTALSAAELEVLLDGIRSLLPMETVQEYTVEAGRPDSITAEKLQVMKKYGVSRISVNPQTFSDATLKLIGRHHTVEQLYEAFALARAEGFDNINMDLILGLPGETIADVEHTFAKVRGLAPDSLTVHSLAVKRASRMKDWIREHGQITGLDYERAMQLGQETAAALGMKPYYLYRQKNMAGALENTGFAREGRYGLYNILIMEEVQSIYAIGAGTVSKRVFTDGSGRIERCDTHKDLSLYLSDIEAMIERKRRLFGNEE